MPGRADFQPPVAIEGALDATRAIDLRRRILGLLTVCVVLIGALAAPAAAAPNADACPGQYMAFYAQLNPGIPLGLLYEGPPPATGILDELRNDVCAA